MSFLRSLRDELFRYRKRKQVALDGKVAGIGYDRPTGDYVTAPIGPWGPLPKDYVPPPPQAYEPHPGFAEFPGPEYETYDPSVLQRSKPTPREPGPADRQLLEPSTPEYDDSLMTDEMFAEAMAEEVGQAPQAEAAPLEDALSAPDSTFENESLEALVAGLMPADPFQEIEAAFDQQMQQAEAQFAGQESQPEAELQAPPEIQQPYEDPWQMFMNPFGGWGPGM